MRPLLRFAAVFNLMAGTILLFFYEAPSIGGADAQTAPTLHVHLIGIVVLLFGFGYWRTAVRPFRNRDLFFVCATGKLAGAALGIWYAVSGTYPTDGLVNLLLSDTVWLPPFAVILSRLYRVRRPSI